MVTLQKGRRNGDCGFSGDGLRFREVEKEKLSDILSLLSPLTGFLHDETLKIKALKGTLFHHFLSNKMEHSKL